MTKHIVIEWGVKMKRFIFVGNQSYPDFGENKVSEFVLEAEALADDISPATGIYCSVRVVDNSIHSHGYDWSDSVDVVAHTGGRFFYLYL